MQASPPSPLAQVVGRIFLPVSGREALNETISIREIQPGSLVPTLNELNSTPVLSKVSARSVARGLPSTVEVAAVVVVVFADLCCDNDFYCLGRGAFGSCLAELEW